MQAGLVAGGGQVLNPTEPMSTTAAPLVGSRGAAWALEMHEATGVHWAGAGLPNTSTLLPKIPLPAPPPPGPLRFWAQSLRPSPLGPSSLSPGNQASESRRAAGVLLGGSQLLRGLGVTPGPEAASSLPHPGWLLPPPAWELWTELSPPPTHPESTR